MNWPSSKMRVVVYSPHFAEYAVRFSIALKAYAEVLLVLDRQNREKEISDTLLATARRRLRIVEFKRYPITKMERFVAHIWIPLRIRMFFPTFAHIQEYGDAITAAMLRRLQGRVPVVLTVHDPQPHTGADSAWFQQALPHLAYMRKAADGLHVHGPYCETLLRRTHNVTQPVLSTRLGVLFVPPDERPAHRRFKRILFFGRMEAYKGLGLFLDALDLLRQRGQDFEAVIAGAGPELDAQADRIALHSDIQVRRGFLSPAEVIGLFQSCCFVVAPYTDATQSGIVAAAFGNGRPVVATRVGGLVDSVDDNENGLTVLPQSPVDFADACQKLLTSSETVDALSHGADRRARNEMSWEVIAGDVAAFYEKLGRETARARRWWRHQAQPKML